MDNILLLLLQWPPAFTLLPYPSAPSFEIPLGDFFLIGCSKVIFVFYSTTSLCLPYAKTFVDGIPELGIINTLLPNH
jgi:hypothetical protein